MKIFDWLAGFCNIEIHSWYCERVITAAAKEGIPLWQIERIDDKTVRAKTGLFDDTELLSLIEREREKLSPDTEIVVCDKDGLIPWLIDHKMRSGFAAGAVICIIAVIMMLSVIWSVDISGLYTVSPKEFSEALERQGLYIGAFANGHDFDAIRFSLIREFEQIAYITFNIDGSRLKVEVTESDQIPETVDNLEYRNIIAKEDGVLIVAEAYEGKIMVEAGHAVEKGELLISGIFPSKEISYRLVRASGKMTAYTKKTYEAFTPYTVTEYLQTDEVSRKYEISIFNMTIPLPFFGDHSYEFFDTEEETVYLTAGEDILPVSVKVSTFNRLEATTHTFTFDEAKDRLLAEIDEKMRIDTHGLEVTDIKVSFAETDLGLYCKTECTVIDDIAMPQKIYTEFIPRKPRQIE